MNKILGKINDRISTVGGDVEPRMLRRRSVETDAETTGDAATSTRANEAPRTSPVNRHVYALGREAIRANRELARAGEAWDELQTQQGQRVEETDYMAAVRAANQLAARLEDAAGYLDAMNAIGNELNDAWADLLLDAGPQVGANVDPDAASTAITEGWESHSEYFFYLVDAKPKERAVIDAEVKDWLQSLPLSSAGPVEPRPLSTQIPTATYSRTSRTRCAQRRRPPGTWICPQGQTTVDPSSHGLWANAAVACQGRRGRAVARRSRGHMLGGRGLGRARPRSGRQSCPATPRDTRRLSPTPTTPRRARDNSCTSYVAVPLRVVGATGELRCAAPFA